MERLTRVPTQKRSLEKYEKIISSAFKLFNEKGYYNTTTIDIANEADVATGSVYSYFKDKKEIYMEILKRINLAFNEPTHDFWLKNCKINFQDAESIKNLFKLFINLMMETHNFSKLFHDDMITLELQDEDIAAIKEANFRRRTKNIDDVFELLSIPFKSAEASEVFKHYCNLLIDDVCHKILYDNSTTNKDLYVEQTVDMLYRLIQNLTNI